MALAGSGTLSLSDIAGEFGGSVPHAISEYYDTGLGPSEAPSSGQIKISDFHGTSALVATDYTNTFATGRSPATYVVGDTFTISSTGLYTFNNLNLDQVDIDIRGGAGGGGWGRNVYRSADGTWVDADFEYFSGNNGGRVVCRMDIGALSDRTMEVRVATGGTSESETSSYTNVQVEPNTTQAGGDYGGGTVRCGGGGGGGRSYWAYDTTDTNELVCAGGGGAGRGNGMGHNSVRENGSAGCDTYSANLEQDVSAAGGGGGYYGGSSACGSGTLAHPNLIMGGSGSGTNFIHDTYDVSTTQNSTYNRSSSYTGYFKMTVV